MKTNKQLRVLVQFQIIMPINNGSEIQIEPLPPFQFSSYIRDSKLNYLHQTHDTLLAGLVAYTFRAKKPSLNIHFKEQPPALVFQFAYVELTLIILSAQARLYERRSAL